MLTCPGNLLQRPPELAACPERLEVHGNFITLFWTWLRTRTLSMSIWNHRRMTQALGCSTAPDGTVLQNDHYSVFVTC